jgi:hypothetical protein
MAKKKTAATEAQATPEVQTTGHVFTEPELFYIAEKSKTMTVAQIATALGLEEFEVATHYPAKPASHMLGLMGRGSKSGKRQGLAVMTEPASMYADEAKPAVPNPPAGSIRTGGRNVECIHRPLG